MFKKNKKEDTTEKTTSETEEKAECVPNLSTEEELKKNIDRLNELQKRPQYIIPILNCIPNDYNENRMNQERLEALKKFILLKGQVGDIVVRPLNIEQYDMLTPPTISEKFIIVDGAHRWKILQELKMTKIAVKIVDYTEREARLATLSFNKIHGSTSQINERRIMDGHWDAHSKDFSDILMMDYIDLVAPEPEVDVGPSVEPDINTNAPVSPNLGMESQAQDQSSTQSQTTKTDNKTDNGQQENSNVKVAGPVTQATPPSKPEETFALPYFFKSSDYEYITDKCMKIRAKYKTGNMADAFVLAFKDGERVMELTEENNRLQKKQEKMEAQDRERKANAEKRKQEKMIKDLAIDKEKKRKQEEKRIAKGNLQ